MKAWFSGFGVRVEPTTYLAAMFLFFALVSLCFLPISAHASPFGTPEAVPVTGFAGWVLAKQAMFYRALSGTLLAAKNDNSAVWTLMVIAFVYGVFHLRDQVTVRL